VELSEEDKKTLAVLKKRDEAEKKLLAARDVLARYLGKPAHYEG